MIPVSNLTSDILYENYISVLNQIQSLGFQVICISVDNHPVNRKFFTKKLCHGRLECSVENPNYPDQPIFLCFDTAHNMKNIYNCWQKRKTFQCPDFQNELDLIQFNHLIEICLSEMGKPIKVASNEIDVSITQCEKSHQFLKFIVSSFFNCVYKNFIREFSADINNDTLKILKLSSK